MIEPHLIPLKVVFLTPWPLPLATLVSMSVQKYFIHLGIEDLLSHLRQVPLDKRNTLPCVCIDSNTFLLF